MTERKTGPKRGKPEASQRGSSGSDSRLAQRAEIKPLPAKSASKRSTAGPGGPSPHRPLLRRVYSDVLDHLAGAEAPADQLGGADLRQTVPADELTLVANEHPGIPDDYLDYLYEVGWGSFLRCRYTVYPRLIPLAERLGDRVAAQLQEPVLCFGDNLTGDVAGFLPEKDWAVVEVTHLDMTLDHTGQTFGQFIRERMGMEEVE